ncbi:hypothetical protein [Frankia gtarii]|uniref:hypothetical protein n=1 Tax=Frankia gtarii TaxID=2950102 RepID=UPI0021C04325|nr:hypothetical protein [Frankia gtarii]
MSGDGDGDTGARADADAPAPAGAGLSVGGFALRVVLVAAGLAALGYGVDGLLTMPRATRPSNAAAWLIGGIVVHDVLLVPATMLVGFTLSRLVRAPYRAVVQGALIVSGAVALMSLPLWRGYGGSVDNPSVNPLPYGRNLAIVLGAVWAGAALLMIGRAVRARRTGPG